MRVQLPPRAPIVKISKVELYFAKIPLEEGDDGFFSERTAFQPNWFPGFHQTDVRFYLLRLEADNGLEGVSAVPTMGSERDGLGPLLGAYLLGLNPLDTRTINQRIQEFAMIGMRNGWIEAAFWDLIGKALSAPVYALLGGSGGYVDPYASLGSNHNHDPRVVAALVRERKNQGYRGVKICVKSLDFNRMVEIVAAARDGGGRDMVLMVDADLGWPVELLERSPRWSIEFGARFAQAIERYSVAWLEEPLHQSDLEGMARLRKMTRTPIAGGEMNASWLEYKRMLELGSLDVYQPDAILAGGTMAGGVSIAYWLAREIEKHNEGLGPGERMLRLAPHTFTNALGFFVNLQLYGLVPPEERWLFELGHDEHYRPEQYSRWLKGGIVRDDEGRIRIPEEPGIGIQIDWEMIRKYGRRLYSGTKTSMGASMLFEQGLREMRYLAKKRQALEEESSRIEFSLPEPPFE